MSANVAAASADGPQLDVEERIKAATVDIDITDMQAANKKDMKEIEKMLGTGEEDDEDPELLKELRRMGYTEDGDSQDDEEAELAKLWAAEHGQTDASGGEKRKEAPSSAPAATPHRSPATSAKTKPVESRAGDEKAAKSSSQVHPKRTKVGGGGSAERTKALAQIEERLGTFRRATLEARNNQDLEKARYLFTFVKRIKSIQAAVSAEKMNPSKAFEALPSFPPKDPPPKSNSSRNPKHAAKPTARKAPLKGRAASSERRRAAQQSRVPGRGARRSGKKSEVSSASSNSQLQVLNSFEVSSGMRKGTDNPALSLKDNLRYATMIEKCARQAELMNTEAKNCLLRKDKDSARKLVRLRAQSLRDRDLLIKAQEKGARPCSCDYNTVQVHNLVSHPELKSDELAITLVAIHQGEDDSKKYQD